MLQVARATADFLIDHSDSDGTPYWDTGALGLGSSATGAAYLSEDPGHQGLLLHAVYHRPNGWDHVPAGSAVPNGEACMWGDYHLLELAVFVQRLGRNRRLTWLSPRPGVADRGTDD